jgi:hypothetical protein
MTVANQSCVEHGRAPCLQTRRRMRRAHDPSRLRRGGHWRSRKAQQQAGYSRHPRRQCQLTAGDEVELPRLAPDFHHHGAERIAGQRVSACPQRGLHVGRAHAHHETRIKAEFAPSVHRQRAGFDFRKILPHPQQRPPRADTPRQPRDKSRRRGALPSLCEHLMHRAERKTALQRHVRPGMAKRHPIRRGGVVGFDALDAAAQPRKRARACAGHAPLLKYLPPQFWERNQKLAHLFMICSNIKLRWSRESIGIAGAIPSLRANGSGFAGPMTGSAKQSSAAKKDWIASSQVLLAMANN